MDLDRDTFDTIHRSLHVSFTVPCPNSDGVPGAEGGGQPLHVVVVDEDTSDPNSVKHAAALLVPAGRESDWIFSTKLGHLQLLRSSRSSLSRIVIIANYPQSRPTSFLWPLLYALFPRSRFPRGLPKFIPFVDSVVSLRTLETVMGSAVGEILVEDVVMERGSVHRRIRFRRVPDLLQSQLLVVGTEPSLDVRSVLEQLYLECMLAGIWMAAPAFESRAGGKPKVVCLGVGGGCLPMLLEQKLGFDVLAIEIDDVVLALARRYFGFVEGENLKACVGDAMELLESLGHGDVDFLRSNWQEKVGKWQDCVGDVDLLMVDIDASTSKDGFLAPPMEFFEPAVLKGARAMLREGGIMVINVSRWKDDAEVDIYRSIGEVFEQVHSVDLSDFPNTAVIASTNFIKQRRKCKIHCLWKDKMQSLIGSKIVNRLKNQTNRKPWESDPSLVP